MTLEGIDVSAYQGAIDWHAVRQSGKRFAFIKATEGTEYIDPYFQQNWYNAKMSGLRRIAYHFFYDHLDAKEQVDFHHRVVRDRGRFEHGDGTMLDVEEVGVSSVQRTLEGINEYVVKALHDIDKQVIIYTDPNTWITLLGNPDVPLLKNRPLYLADLGPYIPKLNTWPNGLSFLQYSFTGHVPGIPYDVDLDRFYGDSHQLDRVLRLQH